MFLHPAWAVGSYSSGHQPGELPNSESTQPTVQPDAPPCTVSEDTAYSCIFIVSKIHFQAFLLGEKVSEVS